MYTVKLDPSTRSKKRSSFYLSLKTGLPGLEFTSSEPSSDELRCSGNSGSGLLGGSDETESLCMLSMRGSVGNGLEGASDKHSESSLKRIQIRKLMRIQNKFKEQPN